MRNVLETVFVIFNLLMTFYVNFIFEVKFYIYHIRVFISEYTFNQILPLSLIKTDLSIRNHFIFDKLILE
jgi:hypothetical protein